MVKVIPNTTFTNLTQLLDPRNALLFVGQIDAYVAEAGNRFIWHHGILVDIRNLSEYKIVHEDVAARIDRTHCIYVPYVHFLVLFQNAMNEQRGELEKKLRNPEQ